MTTVQELTFQALENFATRPTSDPAQKKFLKLECDANGGKYLRVVTKNEMRLGMWDKCAAFFGMSDYNLATVRSFLEKNIEVLQQQNAERINTMNAAIRQLKTRIDHYNENGLRPYICWFRLDTLGQIQAPISTIANNGLNISPTAKNAQTMSMLSSSALSSSFASSAMSITSSSSGSSLQLETAGNESDETQLTETQSMALGMLDVKLRYFSNQILKIKNANFASINDIRQKFEIEKTGIAKHFPLDKLPSKLKSTYLYIHDFIDSLENSLTQKKSARSQEHYVFDKNTNVIRQNAKGNCLVESFSAAIEFQGGTKKFLAGLDGVDAPKDGKYTSAELRAIIANYLTANWKTNGQLSGLMLNAMWDQNAELDDRYEKNSPGLFDLVDLQLADASSNSELDQLKIVGIKRELMRVKKAHLQLEDDELMKQLSVIKISLMQLAINLRIKKMTPTKKTTRQSTKEANEKAEKNEKGSDPVASLTLLKTATGEFRNKPDSQLLSEITNKWEELQQFLDTPSEGDKMLQQLMNNIGELQNSLEKFREEFENKKIDMDKGEKAYYDYIQKVSTDRYHLGYPELIALSQTFRLKVVISKTGQDGNRIVNQAAMKQLPPVTEPLGQIELDYVEGGDSNHWNVVIPN